MRVALITPYDPSTVLGGQERMLLELQAGLKRRGVEAEFISLDASQSRRFSAFGHLPALHLLRSKLRSLDGFDLLHANGWASELLLPHKSPTPLLVTLYGTIAQYLENVRLPQWRRFYLRQTQYAYEKKACREAPHLASLCSKQAEEMVQHYGCIPSHVRAIDCGIDHGIFHPRDRAESRAKLGLPKAGRILLACGRMSDAHKGFDILLKLAKRLGPGDLLVVNGHVPDALRARMLPNMMPTRTAWADMPSLYSAADVFVHPSRYEGFGLVTAEAMACAVPAVAFDTGAARELIGPDEGGFLVGGINDEESFIASALSLLDDPALAAKRGKSASGRAKRFTTERMVDEYITYYTEILSDKQVRA